jgi:hypothetical protein
MAIPDGIFVLFVPAPLLDTKSGPQTAAIATAAHIAKMASDAQVSMTRTRSLQWRVSGEVPVGRCEIFDMGDTSFGVQPRCHPPSSHPCERGTSLL